MVRIIKVTSRTHNSLNFTVIEVEISNFSESWLTSEAPEAFPSINKLAWDFIPKEKV